MSFALVSRICPYCGKNVAFSWVEPGIAGGQTTNASDYHFKDNNNGLWFIGQCPSCENCVLIRMQLGHYHGEYSVTHIFPQPLPSPTDERIPEDIRDDLIEAKSCISVRAVKACVAMCRRALQAACLEKGAKKGDDLYKQIDELKENGVITESIKNWAHTVRWVGNDGLHPGSPVTPDEAEDMLKLTEQMLHILYVMPAIAAKGKESHGKKS